MRAYGRLGGPEDSAPGRPYLPRTATPDGLSSALRAVIEYAGEAADRTAVSLAAAAATRERRAAVSATVHLTIERSRRSRAQAQALRALAARNRERSASVVAALIDFPAGEPQRGIGDP